jgi:predicted HTH transcriptional regulator
MSKNSSKEGLIVPVIIGAVAAAAGYVFFKDELSKGSSNKSKKSSKMARYPKTRKKGRPSGTGSQTERIKKLVQIINEKESFSLSEIRHRFPSVTQRTLRRDMDKLERDGKVTKKGSTRSTIYIKK